MEVKEGKLKSRSRVGIENSAVLGSSSKGKSLGTLGKKSLSRMKVRRQSYGFSGVPGVGLGSLRRRSSTAGLEFKRPPLIYENTYQLGPRYQFHVPSVTKAVNSILDSLYDNTKYNSMQSPATTMLIADEVMRTVRKMNFDRYRIISVVTMAEKKAQCYDNAVAFLWDHQFDNIVDVNREMFTSFIQVTVFGVYLD